MREITPKRIMEMKGKEKITMITAYDYPSALLADKAGFDIVFVGDSLGMVVYGEQNTLNVTMDQMIFHTRAVAKAVKRALVLADMPFGSYEVSVEEGVKNAIKLIQAGADAVKIEGGYDHRKLVKKLVRMGIPVMGHTGLTPQRYLRLGGYRIMGENEEEVEEILRDAKALEKAGAFAVVLEFVLADVAKLVTEEVSIPTIGIGSGPYVDGQVLVWHDVLGLYESSPPFAKRYANLREEILRAISEFRKEVKEGKFPGKEHYWEYQDKETFNRIKENVMRKLRL
ncbi:3-methyl-2-oxobutanoate hydroxymethyltransferase [Pyrococcus furiosus DSM 3638]|uniref:3-methyl-2-oxobutanoate hydroxymethyltransferase n=3 Tax=Pyrococcus furiosus TaxID=2261 RepID=PANB_PYRFU|nr:3-methyl-2-oxobutanoate hydroxymethyltransferase [Pyrococcus furiosus]Q8U1R2.1 RecName: Full=3-methyl-2-oxobutanoate hydroxymethyltransferase; AltName: Full=Ketopantoate hydroxymethyltransferase; Short=KPHMT [Pyrococcus furiosus DSM 3638]AAL81267.1 3-methyl-2-oxobutanoate hydroxymethyltransferase [Pyrococcus furiosus DSM 3638]AFN03935.1 3-methyl-2-oxobutanoate hydroxymethyltransferase [Pyrococcus furiosus COM1]QEK78798.1 3-methyl-2-oxobutanoate hydroxymethyltransferase [Pyrococcus furiosus D